MTEILLAFVFLLLAAWLGLYLGDGDLVAGTTTISVSNYGCIAPGTVVALGDAHYRIISCDRHTITIHGPASQV